MPRYGNLVDIERLGTYDRLIKSHVDETVMGALESSVRYRGTVTSYADLPSDGIEVGDLYNVQAADAEHGINAGDNVIWNGSEWDAQAGVVVISALVKTASITVASVAETAALFG